VNPEANPDEPSKHPHFARGLKHGAWAYLPEHPLTYPLEGNPHNPLMDVLAGLTFSAKDLFKVQGWPQKASTHATLPAIPPSRVVLDLLERGVSCVGLTHLHEIALGITGLNPITGPALNPHDPARISGGSSSGAALSVALHECDFALGTDTGGSIRIPAALCGVVGFKPSKDLYSSEGVLTLSQTCDHVGTLARDVETLQRVHAALHNPASPNNPASLNPSSATPRFGFWDVPHWLSPLAWQAFESVTSSHGALPFAFPEVLETYSKIVQYEAARFHNVALERENPGFSLPTLELLRRGQNISDLDYHAAQAQRQTFTAQLEQLFDRFDILLAPAVPDIAPLVGQNSLELHGVSTPLRQAFLRLTCPFNLAGLPVVCLPLPTGSMWTGLQVIGAKGRDAEVLVVAAALHSRA
jgi:aspartyl-tRNA(Asn)/glutamyl-tRNA(Gln) amidotransferase subunit A